LANWLAWLTDNPILDAITLEADPDGGNGCDADGGRVSNLIPGLEIGGCDFHPCVSASNCETVQAVGGYGVSGNVCRGGNGHTGTEDCVAGQTGGIKNGIRICGAASQSSLGWGSPGNEQAEPDRAIDGDRNSAWGGGSCTHTDIAPTWWQVDLGATAAVARAELWHRSECCPGRLHNAKVIVSATPDFTSGTECGAMLAHCQVDGSSCSQSAAMPNPEVTDCSGASGQYVTVSGTTTNMSICEIEVWGAKGSGGGAPGGSCVGDVCGTVTQTSTDGPGTTYQLGLDLSGSAKNVYTIYGDSASTMAIPAAYQSDAPFGSNIGGVAAAFVAAVPTTADDSWLTVGITGGDGGGSMSSIGIDWSTWTAGSALSTDNGAVFWMSPDAGPSGSAVITQITVTGDFSATISAQGRATSGDDWQASGITFSNSGGGGGGVPAGLSACTGSFTVAVDNAYTGYISGLPLVSDARAAGQDNIQGCDATTTNAFGDVMTGCNWQSADVFEFTDLPGPLVVGIDARDAGGIGGIMANLNVGGKDYVSGSAWRCFYTATQVCSDVCCDCLM
jgi:hypothetical protein